jgi:hypothetical protein
MSESIEAQVSLYTKSLMRVGIKKTSPAGIEPTFKV